MVKYNIISTGSDGNATILEDFVLIDCGVPYKALEPASGNTQSAALAVLRQAA